MSNEASSGFQYLLTLPTIIASDTCQALSDVGRWVETTCKQELIEAVRGADHVLAALPPSGSGVTGGKDVMTPAPSTDQLRLEPVAGTDAPSLSVRDQAEILVGRAQECDLCLADAVVSRRHASVARRNQERVSQ